MPIELDRTTICPFLLRIYWKLNGHNTADNYKQASREIYPNNEILIYTWKDATLKELAQLLTDAVDQANNNQAQISFSIVYPNKEGKFVLKHIGQVYSSKTGPDDEKTLEELGYFIGDFMDVSIYLPATGRLNSSSVIPQRNLHGSGLYSSNRGVGINRNEQNTSNSSYSRDSKPAQYPESNQSGRRR